MRRSGHCGEEREGAAADSARIRKQVGGPLECEEGAFVDSCFIPCLCFSVEKKGTPRLLQQLFLSKSLLLPTLFASFFARGTRKLLLLTRGEKASNCSGYTIFPLVLTHYKVLADPDWIFTSSC